jgi:hypothetical protein
MHGGGPLVRCRRFGHLWPRVRPRTAVSPCRSTARGWPVRLNDPRKRLVHKTARALRIERLLRPGPPPCPAARRACGEMPTDPAHLVVAAREPGPRPRRTGGAGTPGAWVQASRTPLRDDHRLRTGVRRSGASSLADPKPASAIHRGRSEFGPARNRSHPRAAQNTFPLHPVPGRGKPGSRAHGVKPPRAGLSRLTDRRSLRDRGLGEVVPRAGGAAYRRVASDGSEATCAVLSGAPSFDECL